MSKLRKSAKGEECTLQIHPYCNGNPETVVLCHLPSDSGMGQKSPDWWAAYGCSSCHDMIDGRFNAGGDIFIPGIDLEECMRRGHYRTLQRMIEKGLITVA